MVYWVTRWKQWLRKTCVCPGIKRRERKKEERGKKGLCTYHLKTSWNYWHVFFFLCYLFCFICIILRKVGSFHSILETYLESFEFLNLLLSEKIFYFLGKVLKFISFLNKSCFLLHQHEIFTVSMTRRVKMPPFSLPGEKLREEFDIECNDVIKSSDLYP